MKTKLDLISNIFKQNDKLFIKDGRVFFHNDPILIDFFNNNTIYFESDGLDFKLKLSSFFEGTKIFLFKDGLKDFEVKNLENIFIILSINGDFLLHKPNEEIQYSDNVDNEFKLITSNLILYYRFFKFLISTNFSDHFNDSKNEIILYSSSKGIFKINYSDTPNITFKKEENLLVELISIGNQVHYKTFLKNSIYNINNNKGFVTIDEIIENAEIIIENTIRDFELASKRFDFEKFRDSLYKEKEKYFNNIRELVNKVFNQALGIPISISASLFAVNDVKSLLALFIVLLAFVFYIFYYIKIQKIFLSDLNEIENDFKNDFSIISQNSGLNVSVINNEKNKIEKKIYLTKKLIDILMIITVILGSLLSIYIISQMLTIEIANILTNFFNNLFC